MHIALITSGGDCPGLNAAIRAVVKAAQKHNIQVTGLIQGFSQFALDYNATIDFSSYTPVQLDDLLTKGGTILGGINKGDPFHFQKSDGTVVNIIPHLQDNLTKLGINLVIAIGGDGSIRINHKVCQTLSLPLIGIPKTIDNDVSSTDYAIGFMTAVQTATEAIEKIQTTAVSHNRVFVVELMGRDVGFLTLYAGLAAGAHIILVPEFPYDPQTLLQETQRVYQENGYAIIAIAESTRDIHGRSLMSMDTKGYKRYEGIGNYIANWIHQETKLDTRPVVLGHIQRGGAPNEFDRILATELGVEAVRLATQRVYNVVVGKQNDQLVHTSVEDVAGTQKRLLLTDAMVKTALGLGIYLGEVHE